MGLCPFHEDHDPSFIVSPEKNLWHCLGACGEGGSVIDFVMEFDRLSFREAVEKLQAETGVAPGLLPTETFAPPCASSSLAADSLSSAPTRENPLPLEADDQALLERVIGYYHRTLKQSPDGWAYLERRGLADQALVEHFR